MTAPVVRQDIDQRFWGEANPDFFKGTVVEEAASAILSEGTIETGLNG